MYMYHSPPLLMLMSRGGLWQQTPSAKQFCPSYTACPFMRDSQHLLPKMQSFIMFIESCPLQRVPFKRGTTAHVMALISVTFRSRYTYNIVQPIKFINTHKTCSVPTMPHKCFQNFIQRYNMNLLFCVYGLLTQGQHYIFVPQGKCHILQACVSALTCSNLSANCLLFPSLQNSFARLK